MLDDSYPVLYPLGLVIHSLESAVQRSGRERRTYCMSLMHMTKRRHRLVTLV
jgi:hypothetical protein